MFIEINADKLTNGEILTLLFPDGVVNNLYGNCDCVFKRFNVGNEDMQSVIKTSWWDAPYNNEKMNPKERCVYCKAMFDGFCAKAKRNVSWDDMFHNQPHKPEWCPGREPSDEYHD